MTFVFIEMCVFTFFCLLVNRLIKKNSHQKKMSLSYKYKKPENHQIFI